MAWSISGWAKRELPTEVWSLTARTPSTERRAGPVRQPEWRRKTAAAGSGSVAVPGEADPSACTPASKDRSPGTPPSLRDDNKGALRDDNEDAASSTHISESR